MIVRDAREGDIPAILAIYNAVIATSTATYTHIQVDASDRLAWMRERQSKGYPVLVAEREGAVIGYSSFGDFRSFPGYRYSVEHSVHVREGCRGMGAGEALVEALFPPARALGKHVMLGAIDAANDGSIRFHERLGFEITARLPQVGRKFGRWLDLVLMQRYVDSKDAPRPD